jgi:fatty-acyl-CoA synthase
MLSERLHSHGWYHQTISQLFSETCRLRADHAALVFDGHEMRFDQLHTNVGAD